MYIKMLHCESYEERACIREEIACRQGLNSICPGLLPEAQSAT